MDRRILSRVNDGPLPQHRFMWHSMGATDVRINETGIWELVPEMVLNFMLPEPATIRILYSISVMPEQNFALSDGEAFCLKNIP